VILCIEIGLVTREGILTDSTHIKRGPSKAKIDKIVVEKTSSQYWNPHQYIY
jgi:hypothetical protein